MRTVTFVVDESGAKGYSDNRETVKGELGVMAGLLIPADLLDRVEQDVSSIVSRFSSPGKLLITDLQSKDQRGLREGLFHCLLFTIT